MNIRIMTYNIHSGIGIDGKRDYIRIGKFLKDENMDIVLLQELDTRSNGGPEDAIAALQTDHFRYFLAAPTILRGDRWYGNGVLSRFPIIRRNIIDISDDGREPRNIVEVFVETPKGPLHIVNTHKGLNSFERNSQMEKLNKLLSRKSEVPLIVGGDINQWHAFSKGLKKLNFSLHPLRVGATFPTFFPIVHLDRMWCRPASIAISAQVLKSEQTKKFSDHYPVVAEVQI